MANNHSSEGRVTGIFAAISALYSGDALLTKPQLRRVLTSDVALTRETRMRMLLCHIDVAMKQATTEKLFPNDPTLVDKEAALIMAFSWVCKGLAEVAGIPYREVADRMRASIKHMEYDVDEDRTMHISGFRFFDELDGNGDEHTVQ